MHISAKFPRQCRFIWIFTRDSSKSSTRSVSSSITRKFSWSATGKLCLDFTKNFSRSSPLRIPAEVSSENLSALPPHSSRSSKKNFSMNSSYSSRSFTGNSHRSSSRNSSNNFFRHSSTNKSSKNSTGNSRSSDRKSRKIYDTNSFRSSPLKFLYEYHRKFPQKSHQRRL